MKLTLLTRVVGLALGLLLAALMGLLHLQQISLAQGGGPISLKKTLNKTDNVVRVGEVLSFTIALTNNSSFTLTNVTIVDNYDNTVLAFTGANPPPDGHDAGAGVITWNNVVTAPFPVANLAPGQSVSLIVFFIAEHPKPTVVNRARAQDLVSSMGAVTQTAETSRTQEAMGGAAPVYKSLFPPDAAPQAGLPITFTHLITNDGAALLTRLPLTDTYDPNFLQFKSAIPTPTIISPPGLLVWADLTDNFGDLPPFGTVVVTTVFTATTEVLTTVNRASTEGARDEYDNDLTAGLAEVPIIIIAGETPTPIPTATSAPKSGGDDDDDDGDSGGSAPAAPTAAVQPTLTPSLPLSLTAQAETSGPKYLPETGFREQSTGYFARRVWFWVQLGAVLMAASLVWIICRRVKTKL